MTSTIDHRLMVHRLNLPSSAEGESAFLKDLVGSKSGIALFDSKTRELSVPLSSSAEVDFWVFADRKIVVTHYNPSLSLMDQYPSLESFLGAWATKRSLESSVGVPHGIILANVKTHGSEEDFLQLCGELGIPSSEVILLDQEYPATDRILRERRFGNVAPLAIRVSRIEPLAAVLAILENRDTFAVPYAVFLDPIGFSPKKYPLLLNRDEVERMYELAPSLEFIVCCPSRWGEGAQIDPLAEFLKQVGVRQPLIMTDLPLFPQWSRHLEHWPRQPNRIHSAA